MPSHVYVCTLGILVLTSSGVTRALIGGGCIFIYSCSARQISFEMNLKTKKFKINSSGRTQIYMNIHPLPINALVTPLLTSACVLYLIENIEVHSESVFLQLFQLVSTLSNDFWS